MAKSSYIYTKNLLNHSMPVMYFTGISMMLIRHFFYHETGIFEGPSLLRELVLWTVASISDALFRTWLHMKILKKQENISASSYRSFSRFTLTFFFFEAITIFVYLYSL